MSETELRTLVRDVLREVLAGRGQASTAPTGQTEPVRLTGDADLAAFVRRLIGLLDDPATGDAVRSGRYRFTLAAGGQGNSPTLAPAAGQPAVLGGAVTETKLNKHAGAGTVYLAPDAVVTPLARDRARALGLKLKRKG